MTLQLSKAPIVELIAEMHWLPITSDGSNIAADMFVMTGPAEEDFYEGFRRSLKEFGFDKVERLQPPGFPIGIHTAIYKHTRLIDSPSGVVVQIGPGLLSIHALPPYKDWTSFRPTIEQALMALITARPRKARSQVFTRVLLRYINVFDANLMGGLTMLQFIRDVLKIGVSLPEVLKSETQDSESVTLTVSVQMRTKDQRDLTLSVGPKPNSGDENSVVLDTFVATCSHTAWNADSVVESLDSSHESINRLFFGLTSPILSLMQ